MWEWERNKNKRIVNHKSCAVQHRTSLKARTQTMRQTMSNIQQTNKSWKHTYWQINIGSRTFIYVEIFHVDWLLHDKWRTHAGSHTAYRSQWRATTHMCGQCHVELLKTGTMNAEFATFNMFVSVSEYNLVSIIKRFWSFCYRIQCPLYTLQIGRNKREKAKIICGSYRKCHHWQTLFTFTWACSYVFLHFMHALNAGIIPIGSL